MAIADASHVQLLDTSILIDYFKMPSRRSQIKALINDGKYHLTTGIALLEFKAVFIAECINIYNRLRQSDSFIETRDEHLELNHRQKSLRSHIFNNIINVFAEPGTYESPNDARIARQAAELLAAQIPDLYEDCLEMANTVYNDQIKCSRLSEKPERQRVRFSTNLPTCVRNRNKTCDVEKFVRSSGAIVDALDSIDLTEHPQLTKSLQLLQTIRTSATIECSHGECRSMGDFLIATEGKSAGANIALSTNAVDWQIVSKINSLDFHHVEYVKPF